MFSFVAGIAISNAFLPKFNELLDLNIPYNLDVNRFVFISLLGSAIFLGGLSGLYPAIYSSVVSPANSLKGKWHGGGKSGVVLKNSLVVAQLMAAIILVVGCIVVFKQLQFIQTKKLGFERDQIIYIPYQQVRFFDKTSTLTNELLKNQNILKVSVASTVPLNSGNQGIATSWEGNTQGNELFIYRTRIDYNYIDLFQIEMTAGRNFSPAFPIDSLESYILNEAAVKALGWDKAVGKSFEGGTVVGVVKDFHFQPFNFTIEPMFMKFRNRENSLYGNIILKIVMDDKEQTLAYVKKTLSDLVPEIPFNYHYMDDSYNEMYKTEKRFSWIINIFTFVALFISVIGLLGLINQNVVQRIKEIGIRKVLGASVVNILAMLSKGFFKLVLISIMVASPIAYYLSSKWLERFAYKIDLVWWIFVVAGLLTAFTTMIAIGFQATKAALMNPINSLKSE
jgi:putative ABC transport system permease protein